MRQSIRVKLILTYAVIIFMMAGFSLSFVSVFSESYIVNESKKQIREYADRIAVSLVSNYNSPTFNSLLDFRNVLSRITENDYSVIIFDSKNEIMSSLNTAITSLTRDEITENIRDNLSADGEYIFKHDSSAYTYCVRQIKRADNSKFCSIVVLMQIDKYNIDSLLLLLFFVATGFASAIAVISAYFFSGQLTSNLKQLKIKANMLAQRKFDTGIVINTDDEVGELARSFDEMAKSIEEYDRSQKVFLQNASHELRTPLMSIRGYVEGLKDGVFENTDEIYDTILNQTSRLEKLIEQVMYLSKIETAKDILQLSPVLTVDLINEAIDRVMGIAAAANIEIIKGDIVILNINIDADHMTTVFTNILSNCLRFAKSQIIIEAVPTEGGVTFTITDDGPGIAEEDLPHLFERFYRGKQGKHGLGLAIANAVVLSHKGTITAYNRRDGKSGAVFQIFLPTSNTGTEI